MGTLKKVMEIKYLTLLPADASVTLSMKKT